MQSKKLFDLLKTDLLTIFYISLIKINNTSQRKLQILSFQHLLSTYYNRTFFPILPFTTELSTCHNRNCIYESTNSHWTFYCLHQKFLPFTTELFTYWYLLFTTELTIFHHRSFYHLPQNFLHSCFQKHWKLGLFCTNFHHK